MLTNKETFLKNQVDEKKTSTWDWGDMIQFDTRIH